MIFIKILIYFHLNWLGCLFLFTARRVLAITHSTTPGEHPRGESGGGVSFEVPKIGLRAQRPICWGHLGPSGRQRGEGFIHRLPAGDEVAVEGPAAGGHRQRDVRDGVDLPQSWGEPHQRGRCAWVRRGPVSFWIDTSSKS